MSSKSKRNRNVERIPMINATNATEDEIEVAEEVVDGSTYSEASADNAVSDAELDAALAKLEHDDAEKRFAQDASDIADTASKLSDVLGGEPVSDKPIPINIAEPPSPTMGVMRLGDMDVYATPDRIDVVRQHMLPEADAPKPVAVGPTPKISDKIAAEQAAGRKALAKQAERAAFNPRPLIVPEKHSIEVYQPGDITKLQAHMLNTPVAGKGQGY